MKRGLMTRFHKAKPDFEKPITKSSTIMIYNLIRTNSLLSNLVERQNAEIEMLNFRIGGFLDYLKIYPVKDMF